MVGPMQDESGAASTVVAFLVAGVIFVASVGALLMTAQDSSSGAGEAGTGRQVLQADALADLLVQSPGFHLSTVNGQTAYAKGWSNENADELGRLGLRDDDDPLMNFTKFQNLRRAGLASKDDNLVNYPDARASLGLDDTDLDFHVRAFPSLRSVREVLESGDRDPNLRVTYIGHYNVTYNTVQVSPPSPTYMMTVTKPTCSVLSDVTDSPPQGNPSTAPQNYRLQATVTNGGQSTTQFSALFTYKLGSYQGSRATQSFLLDPSGGTGTVFVDIPARSGVTCPVGSTISVTIQDPTTNTVTNSTTLATAVTGATASLRDLNLETSKSAFKACTGASNTDPVTLDWSSPSNDIVASDKLAMKVIDRNTGAKVWPTSSEYFAFKGNDGKRAQLTGVCLGAGQYRAYLYYYTGNSPTPNAQHVVQRVVVTSSTVAGYVAPGLIVDDLDSPVYHQQPPVAVEASYLEQLVERFCPTFVDSKTSSPLSGWGTWDTRCKGFADGRTVSPSNQPGDIIPDAKKTMNEALPNRLVCQDEAGCPGAGRDGGTAAKDEPRYDITSVLVVGSDVSHTAMTSGAAKFAVRDWVLGGGTLIVFGSTAQNVNWLEPLFHAAIASSSFAVSTPDASHPILNRADQLAYDTYDTNGQVWSFNGQTAQDQDELLTNVVAVQKDTQLAISNPGAFGDGTLILTSWLPYDLFGTGSGTSTAEGLKVVNNFLMQGYRDLFLDYGLTIPVEARQAAATQRVVQIQHPSFDDPITLTVFVYVF